MRRTAALVLLVLAVPLIAFPIVAPPADPPDHLHHTVFDTDAPPGEGRTGGETIAYENLSERGQTLFSAASETRRTEAYVVDVGNGAPELNYSSGQHLNVVRDGTVHLFQGRQVATLPDGQSVLLRLGSLLAGVVAAALGGYWRLNADA